MDDKAQETEKGEHLKRSLEDVKNHLGGLETAARKLENQNFADIIKHATGRLSQAQEHADIGLVEDKLRDRDEDPGQEKFPFGDGKEAGQ